MSRARRSTALYVAASIAGYLAAALVITGFFVPEGGGLVVFAIPLYAVTRAYGRRAGFAAAAAGVVVNPAIWVLVGNGARELPHASALFLVSLVLAQCVGGALFVLLVSALRRGDEESRRDAELSRDLLRQSEVRYRSLIERAPAAMFVMEGGRLSYFNDRAMQMLGYAREQMRGLPMTSILHPDDLKLAREMFDARSEGEDLPTSLTRIRTRSGSLLWVETVGQKIQWEGRPAVLYFSTDVSARVEAEKALRESELRYRISESKYRNLIEVAPEAIYVVEDGRISFCNSHFQEMLGYREEEIRGRSIQDLTHPDDLGASMERYARRVEGQVLPAAVLRHVRKDGAVIWVETVGQRIEWEGRPAVLYFSSDVTARKTLEEQYVQAQKMEAIGRLAGGVAHDFNNLLQVILGFATTLKDYLDDRPAVLRDLGMIEEAATKAASLTQQLLAFSRKQVIKPRVIDIGQLLQRSEQILGRLLGHDISLVVKLGTEDSRVRADESQLQQVVMNLAINARDAMPSGGTITVTLDNVVLPGDAAAELPAGSYVRLVVEDTGRGMDAETLRRLFEPFFTTKENGTGSGLGLSIVYGVVRQAGGRIHAESTPGSGSRFVVYLPRVFEESETVAVPSGERPRGSGSVLVVEDLASVRRFVKEVLERSGYSVTAVASGEEAVKIAIARGEGFDLLLTDIFLTGIRGEEVADAVRVLNPRTRVIYMSGYVSPARMQWVNGAAFLQKPFTPSSLLQEVRKSLAS
ncbi:MAG TPA: PAS domain S-box protein [Spirochaetia bacterium]|nr:PAS domain S-box protein [Spirochaetia bacterium]